jgi:hypothetical protein
MGKSKAQQEPRERRQSTPEAEMALAEQVSAAVLEQAGDCACPGGMRGPVVKVDKKDCAGRRVDRANKVTSLF